MTDQRLAGMSHQELWILAHGGYPAAASTSQANLAKAARVLENISRTLSAPLNEFGLGWQGQAANAARAGIGQHAGWAEAVAGRASAAANQAGQQAASARMVIAEMPPPAPPPAAGANWAKAEEASANARLRAVELMQGHATECTQTRPSAAFGRPPAAGSTTGATSGTVAGAGTGARTMGRGVPNVPTTNPAAAERVTPSRGGASRAVRWASPADSPTGAAAGHPPGGTGTHPAAVQPVRTGRGGPVPGFAPAGIVESEPSRAARFPVPPVGEPWPGAQPGPLGAAPGRQAPPHILLPRPDGGRDDLATRGQRGGADGAGPLAPRGSPELLVPGPPDPDPAGPRGQTHPSADPRGHAHASVDTSLLPLLPGGLGLAESERDGHRRLDYLLDEDDVFGENEWVTPPVIGS